MATVERTGLSLLGESRAAEEMCLRTDKACAIVPVAVVVLCVAKNIFGNYQPP